MEHHRGRNGQGGGSGEDEAHRGFSAPNETTESSASGSVGTEDPGTTDPEGRDPGRTGPDRKGSEDAAADPAEIVRMGTGEGRSDGSDSDVHHPVDTSRPPAWLSDHELELSVLATIEQINRLEARLAASVTEFHRRRIADDTYVLTTKQWLQHVGRLSPSRASTILRVGHALESMPTATEYAQSGRITPDGLRMLAAAYHDHPVEFALHEEVLADAATTLGTRDLRRVIDHWEQQVSYPDAVTEMEAKKRRRRISCNQTWDGMWSISGMLDPESGHVVSTALQARIGSAPLDSVDTRTPGQKAADALVDICSYSLDHAETTETSGGSKPHVTVTLDYDTLTTEPWTAPSRALPELDGLPITPEDARRIACDAGVVRVITSGDSTILDVGRSTRTIPPAIRRAVEHRDGGCAWAGCDARTSWCDVHHITHWAHGGETSLGNLMLLCRRHHSAVHEGRSPP